MVELLASFCLALVVPAGDIRHDVVPAPPIGGQAVTIAALSPIARIHGKIVQIDRARGTFLIHHAPFAAMPMAMTMEVEPKHRADLGKLHVGEVVDVTIDTRIVPWPGTDIRPAPRHPAGER